MLVKGITNFDVMNTDLINLFAKTFGIPEDLLQLGATLESLGLDSLFVIEFLFQIEDRFHVQISDQANPPRTLDERAQPIDPLTPKNPPESLALDG